MSAVNVSSHDAFQWWFNLYHILAIQFGTHISLAWSSALSSIPYIVACVLLSLPLVFKLHPLCRVDWCSCRSCPLVQLCTAAGLSQSDPSSSTHLCLLFQLWHGALQITHQSQGSQPLLQCVTCYFEGVLFPGCLWSLYTLGILHTSLHGCLLAILHHLEQVTRIVLSPVIHKEMLVKNCHSWMMPSRFLILFHMLCSVCLNVWY